MVGIKAVFPSPLTPFIENLVQRMDRRRFRFEMGDSSNGPGLMASQIRSSEQGVTQEGL